MQPISTSPRRVAVIGAGLSGSTCAHHLLQAGIEVEVFEKSRGAGGRMATRRIPPPDRASLPRERWLGLDHGVPCWSARTEEFQRFLEEMQRLDIVRPWRLDEPAADARASAGTGAGRNRWVAVPDMPSLSRYLLGAAPLHTGLAVDRLERKDGAWGLWAGDSMLGQGFDGLVLAIPSAQSAPLVQPFAPEWADSARLQVWQPCWTLMAACAAQVVASTATLWAPREGPLGCVVHQSAKPGARAEEPEIDTWVAHARLDWTQSHLEMSAETVLPLLQRALETELMVHGLPAPQWRFATAHRWRYAQAGSPWAGSAGEPLEYRWNPAAGIGLCGDSFSAAAQEGVEAAWRSGRALAAAVLNSPGTSA